jgi:prepilin-type N-terminal cleavage/methylation domain-containing protein
MSKTTRAFSLIEIMIALFILTMALAPMIPNFSAVRVQSINARNWVIAHSFAANKLESFKTLEKVTPQLIKVEKKIVNNTKFEIFPQYKLISKPAGFENSNPEIMCVKFRVDVKWSTPGRKNLKHGIFLETLIFRPKS